jgi:hypothetical protein
MNRVISLVVAALLTTFVGYTQDIPNVDIKDFTLELKDGYLNVDIDIDLSQLDIKTTQVVVLTPNIVKGADTLRLKSIGVYGRNRRIYYERNEDIKPTNAGDMDLTTSETEDIIHYSTSVAFMEWINGCSVQLAR